MALSHFADTLTNLKNYGIIFIEKEKVGNKNESNRNSKTNR